MHREQGAHALTTTEFAGTSFGSGIPKIKRS
jgi:hypothetical protein